MKLIILLLSISLASCSIIRYYDRKDDCQLIETYLTGLIESENCMEYIKNNKNIFGKKLYDRLKNTPYSNIELFIARINYFKENGYSFLYCDKYHVSTYHSYYVIHIYIKNEYLIRRYKFHFLNNGTVLFIGDRMMNF